MNTKGHLALAQIFILVFGIVSIGWAIGSEVRIVSGAETIAKSGWIAIETGEIFKTETEGAIKFFTEPNLKAWDSTTSVPAGGTLPKYDVLKFEDGRQGFFNEKRQFKMIGEPSADGTIVVNREGIWTGYGTGFLGHLAQGFVWAGVVAGGIKMIGPILGIENELVDALSGAAFGGIMAGKGVIGAIDQWANTGPDWLAKPFFTDAGKVGEFGQWFGEESWTNAQVTGVVVGVAVAAIIIYNKYKKEETEIVTFTCEEWQAPTGGNMCEQCNNQGILPCSEYQCRSLGQSCELINKGTEEEKCVWVNRNDVTPPTISLWLDILSKDHRYTPDTSVSPPDVGTRIVNTKSEDGCIPAFTPLQFGIVTNEPASCRIDYVRKTTFENMSHYLGGTPAFLYNHSQIMSLPGSSNLIAENITIENDGEYSLFVRCLDSNGNENLATWVFRFCVDKGPDTTPPLIVATNLLNNMPIAHNQSSVNFEAYINEPATCRWSRLDKTYEEMENQMKCSSSVIEMNAQMVYKCGTTIDGLKSSIENNFYMKCEDQPLKPVSDRNRNTESLKFTLIGTAPLVITDTSPNGTIKDSTDVVKVTLGIKTAAGYEEGRANCYYSPTETANDYVLFFNTDSYIHTQELYLPEGEYIYYLKCVDLGGNSDTRNISFNIETDTSPPIVVRAYNEESHLKIISNEPAQCVYGIIDCTYNFEDGLKISSIDQNQTQHYVSWDTGKTFYIKCMDKYENKPYPDQCSIILKPNKEQIVK